MCIFLLKLWSWPVIFYFGFLFLCSVLNFEFVKILYFFNVKQWNKTKHKGMISSEQRSQAGFNFYISMVLALYRCRVIGRNAPWQTKFIKFAINNSRRTKITGQK